MWNCKYLFEFRGLWSHHDNSNQVPYSRASLSISNNFWARYFYVFRCVRLFVWLIIFPGVRGSSIFDVESRPTSIRQIILLFTLNVSECGSIKNNFGPVIFTFFISCVDLNGWFWFQVRRLLLEGRIFKHQVQDRGTSTILRIECAFFKWNEWIVQVSECISI